MAAFSTSSPWDKHYPEFAQIKHNEERLREKFLQGEYIEPLSTLIVPDLEAIRSGLDEAFERNKKYQVSQLRMFDNPDKFRKFSGYHPAIDFATKLPETLKPHVVVAGGSICDAIMRREFWGTDFDLFIVGTDNPSGILTQLTSHITNYIKSKLGNRNVFGFRTKHSVTIKVAPKDKHPPVIFQIILRSYKSPDEVLTGFDLDASGCCYYQNQFYCTPRALFSIQKMRLFIDVDRASRNYSDRLIKYAMKRGFALQIPVDVSADHFDQAIRLVNLTNVPHKIKDRKKIHEKIKNNPGINSLVGLLYLQIQVKSKSLVDQHAEKDASVKLATVKDDVDLIPTSTDYAYIPDRIEAEQMNFLRVIPDVGYGFKIYDKGVPLHYLLDYTEIGEEIQGIPYEAEFIVENPGRQFSASFNPLDITWEAWWNPYVLSDLVTKLSEANKSKSKEPKMAKALIPMAKITLSQGFREPLVPASALPQPSAFPGFGAPASAPPQPSAFPGWILPPSQ